MFWFSTKMGVKTLALQLCLFQILLKVHAEDPVDNPACIWKDPKTGDVYNLNPLANLQQGMVQQQRLQVQSVAN